MIKWIIGIVVYLAIGILFGAVMFKITSELITDDKFAQDVKDWTNVSNMPIEYVMFWLTMLFWPYEVVYATYLVCKKTLGKKKD